MSTRNNILTDCELGCRNLVYCPVLIAYLCNRTQKLFLLISSGKSKVKKRGDILWQNQV